MPGTDSDADSPIICRVTPWYFRRMGVMALMFLGMGLYFIYDGKVGYPKENGIAAQKEWYEQEIIGGPKKADREIESYEEAHAQGEEITAAWMKMAREKGWVINPDLKEPRWADYAAARGWPESPKYHSPEKIREQYYFGGALVFGAVVAGLLVLRNRNKVLTGYADHMVMPDGVRVRFDQVTCVDKRKWEHKGLAYVHFTMDDACGQECPRSPQGAPTRRVVIDDLMYGGAGKVLKRLLGQFKGELIEKVMDEEAVAQGDAGKHASGEELPPKG